MYLVKICSSEPGLLKVLKEMTIDNYPLKIYKYTSKFELEADVKCENLFTDILILDIEESKSYIELAKIIQENNRHIQVIFVGKNRKDISYIFEATPVYILMKPVEKKEIRNAIKKSIQNIERNEKNTLKLYVDKRMLQIPFHEILYIESDLRYLIIHRDNRTDKVMMKMSEITERLPDYFVRCHQSYMINIKKIAVLDKNNIEIEGEKRIPISRNRMSSTKEAIENYYNGVKINK